MTQPEFAAVGKVEKNTQINYEQDKRSPTADYLLAVATIGVNTQYVLHGELSGENLADDEKELLIGYRKLDIRGKARVLGVIEGANESAPSQPVSKRKASITIHGSVGQQIKGDITAPQTINVGGKKK